MIHSYSPRFLFSARVALLLALLGLLAACATTPPSSSAPAAAAASEPVYDIEPWDGDGMDIPLDGSSLDAFQRSLARVKAHTSESDYVTLTNAIEYLLFYELAVKRDRTLLAANLDGLTGYEVIDRVELIRSGVIPEPRFPKQAGETEA